MNSVAVEIEDIVDGVRGHISKLPAYKKLAANDELTMVELALARLDSVQMQVADMEQELEELRSYG
jgi:hypothetical protein